MSDAILYGVFILVLSLCTVLATRHIWLFSSVASNHAWSRYRKVSYPETQLESHQQIPGKGFLRKLFRTYYMYDIQFYEVAVASTLQGSCGHGKVMKFE